MKYKILIEETISQMFDIEADCLSDARSSIRKDYLEGRLVLESGNLEEADFMIYDADGIQQISELEKIV